MGKTIVTKETKINIVHDAKTITSISEIARLNGVSRKCVQNTIKKFEETGSVEDKPRSGRPRCTTSRQDAQLVRLSKSNRFYSIRKLSSEWTSEGQNIGFLDIFWQFVLFDWFI